MSASICRPASASSARRSGCSARRARAPARDDRRSSSSSCSARITWVFVSRHPYRCHASTQVVLPVAFAAFAGLGFAVRRAQRRDHARWRALGLGRALGFTQQASRDRHRAHLRRRHRARGASAARGGSSPRATGIASTRSSASCGAPSCRSASTPATRRCARASRATAGSSTRCWSASSRGAFAVMLWTLRRAHARCGPVKSRLPPCSASRTSSTSRALIGARRAEALGERDDLAVDVVDLRRPLRLEIVPHRRPRVGIDRDHACRRAAGTPRSGSASRRGIQRGGTQRHARDRLIGPRAAARAPRAAPRRGSGGSRARASSAASGMPDERVDRVVEVHDELGPLHRGHVVAQLERRGRRAGMPRSAAPRRRRLDGERAARARGDSARGLASRR